MAVAAPKLRSPGQTAPPPSRIAPPEPKKRPRDRPRPGGQGRSATAPAAPAKRKTGAPRKVRIDDPPRKPGGRKKATTARAMAAKAMPARKAAPKGKAARGATAKAAPARRKVAPKRRPASVIPIAAGHAGRAAVAVTQLPESGLIHRLTRGRAWIGVLGVLLVGIVALNVVTLSFAASSGKIFAKNSELAKENSMLQSLAAKKLGQAKIRHEAAALGLKMATEKVPQLVNVHNGDVAEAASRLAAAAAGTASAEESTGEESAGGEGATTGTATSEETVTGEETSATSAEGEFTPEELAIYEREYAELLASEGVTEAPAG
jgi:hypothetical protein